MLNDREDRPLKPDNTEALANALYSTQERGVRIEEKILRIGCKMHPSWPFKFFVHTIDLETLLYYGAVSNISEDELIGLLKSDTQDKNNAESIGLLATLRNTLAFGKREPGYLTRFVEHIARHEIAFAIAPIDPSGAVRAAQYYESDLTQRVDVSMQNDSESVGPRITALIRKFRDELGSTSDAYFFAKYGDRLDDPPSRASTFVQFGFAFLDSRHTLTEEVRQAWWMLACISDVATASIFWERERYFGKSIRQAIYGDMIKCDEGTALKDQVDRLDELKRYNVPRITESALDTQAGYYAMSRFVIPSMSKVLTHTAGFLNYEIEGLAKACMRHLRETYWSGEHWEVLKTQSVKVFVQVRWAQAQRAATAARRALEAMLAACADPAHLRAFSKGARMVQAGDVRKWKSCMRRLLRDHDVIDLTVKWGNGNYHQPVVPVLDVLADVCTWGKNVSDGCKDLKKVRANAIHGDAHLDNILVDASVPEDPLIVSIDPLRVQLAPPPQDDKAKAENAGMLSNTKEVLKECGWRYDDMNIEMEVSHLCKDPGYDYAKLLLSTACAYGLVNRGVFRLAPGGAGDNTVRIARIEKQKLKVDADSGGISQASRYWREPATADDAWRYHRVTAGEVVREFLRTLGGSGCNAKDCVVALAGLWLMTGRHAFSISEKLLAFGGQTERALVMYLFAEAFVSRGAKHVLEGLKSDEPSWDDVDQICSSLALPKLELIRARRRRADEETTC